MLERTVRRLGLASLLGLAGVVACGDDSSVADDSTESSSETGDGDGDPDPGDGDGDPGDDDGDPDPGDGDGDPDPGDGDGDPDPGDGDGDGDGDGEPGDGDGEPGPVCGDGNLDADEACDDGNLDANDGCESDCTLSVGVRKIVDGTQHTCVLMWGGQVKCWGYNFAGQLGQGNTMNIGDDEPPSSIDWIDLGDAAVELAAGLHFTCAILTDASVKCWGHGNFGQLGYGDTEWIGDDELPSSVGVVDLGDAAVKLTAGSNHACALTDQQTVRCWGDNDEGQLGYGNTVAIGDDEAPSTAGTVSLGGPVASISAAGSSTCALLESGAVRCWGFNDGRLGLGHTDNIGDDELPSSVDPLSLGDDPVVELVRGAFHGCVRYADGTIRCWGHNNYGQLGYANTTRIGDDELPIDVGTVDVGASVDGLVLGRVSTCARIGNALKCWGYGGSGSNGYGSPDDLGDDEVPASYGSFDLGFDLVGLSEGSLGQHNCAHDGATIRCWGANEYGQLGYGDILPVGDDEAPSAAGPVDYL